MYRPPMQVDYYHDQLIEVPEGGFNADWLRSHHLIENPPPRPRTSTLRRNTAGKLIGGHNGTYHDEYGDTSWGDRATEQRRKRHIVRRNLSRSWRYN